ncbi:hypothetical protein [Streptomyces sp. AM6-12]|uniref:hypothetical protein n=1 Tax=Streptomyces sp. AM6-12 TaxID=3345149 RepID=UPI0037A6AEE0
MSEQLDDDRASANPAPGQVGGQAVMLVDFDSLGVLSPSDAVVGVGSGRSDRVGCGAVKEGS